MACHSRPHATNDVLRAVACWNGAHCRLHVGREGIHRISASHHWQPGAYNLVATINLTLRSIPITRALLSSLPRPFHARRFAFWVRQHRYQRRHRIFEPTVSPRRRGHWLGRRLRAGGMHRRLRWGWNSRGLSRQEKGPRALRGVFRAFLRGNALRRGIFISLFCGG